MKKINWFYTYKKQVGAGLIEVMVSLLILGVGLLGVLSLQANGLNSNQRALFVTEAQFLAQDMADRLIAFGSTDSDLVANAVVDGTAGYDGPPILKGSRVSTAACTTAAPCSTPGDILAYDRNEWLQALNDSSLPRASAQVSWVDPVYTIQVMWDQERSGGGGAVTTCNPTSNCFEMEVRLP